MRLGLFSGPVLAAAVAAATAIFPAAAFADKRVALVIGNSAYQKVHALSNPANDAQAWMRAYAASPSCCSPNEI